MPTDPNISLQVKPMEAYDPIAQYAKIQGVRNMIAQNGLIQQEAQQNQAKAQREQQQYDQGQRDLQAQQTEGQLMADNTTQGPDGSTQVNHQAVVKGLAQAGFGQQAATYKTRVQLPDQKQQIEDQKNKLTNVKDQVALASNAAQALMSVPDDQLPAEYDRTVQDLTDKGVVKQGQLPPSAQILQSAGGNPAALRQFVQQQASKGIAAQQQLEIHQKELDYAQEKTEFQYQVAKDAPDTFKKWLQAAAPVFAKADSDLAWADAQKTLMQQPGMTHSLLQAMVGTFGQYGPGAAQRASALGMTTEQQAATAETARKNRADEANQAIQRGINQQRANAESLKATTEAKKFAQEFGGDAVKGWAASLAQNPDAAASVPPALRNAVQQQFQQNTGLPFPKPLTGQAVDQERSARSVMDTLRQINEDAQDPEIQSRIGPILGRLGNAEQATGAAVGLSPSAEAKAQRLRTNMRYMVFGEGKALMGGRLPQNLMSALESSSPSVKMDGPTLNGAMSGVQDAAMRALDTADQQRFGGKMRSREARGITPLNLGGPVRLNSADDYKKLPAGASYIDSDGKTYTKK